MKGTSAASSFLEFLGSVSVLSQNSTEQAHETWVSSTMKEYSPGGAINSKLHKLHLAHCTHQWLEGTELHTSCVHTFQDGGYLQRTH